MIVDNITYLIRDFNIFIDCPYCDISCGLRVMGAHFVEDHKMASFTCFGCRVNIPSDQCQNHLVNQHGTLRCNECREFLTLMELKLHLKSYCRKLLDKPCISTTTTKNPTVPCPYCDKQCCNLNKHIKGSVHTWNKVGQIYLGCEKKHILLKHFGEMFINY